MAALARASRIATAAPAAPMPTLAAPTTARAPLVVPATATRTLLPAATTAAASRVSYTIDTMYGTQSNSATDSTMGKLMEKAGGMFKNEGIADKGRAKREDAGFGQGNDNSDY